MAKHNLKKVIKIGEELFKTKGYFNTGTEEILEKSKFPRSSFYHHFKNKEGFAVRVLENYGEDSVSFYKSILADNGIKSPKERIKVFFTTFSDLAEKRNFKSQCLIQKMSGECAGTNDFIRKSAEIELLKLLNVYQTCILEGQELGEIRNDVDALKLAQFLQAQLYGSNNLARLSKNKRVMEENLNLALDYISI